MLAGVKSQMSGWLAGGIPTGILGRGSAGTTEGELAPGEANESQTTSDVAQAPASENVKDDDASRYFFTLFIRVHFLVIRVQFITFS